MRFIKISTVAVITLFSTSILADVHVNGYVKKDGTYVAPHYRSSPNSSFDDNWSTKGNVNPYTGEEGSLNPYKEKKLGTFEEGHKQSSFRLNNP